MTNIIENIQVIKTLLCWIWGGNTSLSLSLSLMHSNKYDHKHKQTQDILVKEGIVCNLADVKGIMYLHTDKIRYHECGWEASYLIRCIIVDATCWKIDKNIINIRVSWSLHDVFFFFFPRNCHDQSRNIDILLGLWIETMKRMSLLLTLSFVFTLVLFPVLLWDKMIRMNKC